MPLFPSDFALKIHRHLHASGAAPEDAAGSAGDVPGLGVATAPDPYTPSPTAPRVSGDLTHHRHGVLAAVSFDMVASHTSIFQRDEAQLSYWTSICRASNTVRR